MFRYSICIKVPTKGNPWQDQSWFCSNAEATMEEQRCENYGGISCVGQRYMRVSILSKIGAYHENN